MTFNLCLAVCSALVMLVQEAHSFGCDLDNLQTFRTVQPFGKELLTVGFHMSLDSNANRNQGNPTLMSLLKDGTLQHVSCNDSECHYRIYSATNRLKHNRQLISSPGDTLLSTYDRTNMQMAVVDGIDGHAGSIMIVRCSDSICKKSVTVSAVATAVHQKARALLIPHNANNGLPVVLGQNIVNGNVKIFFCESADCSKKIQVSIANVRVAMNSSFKVALRDDDVITFAYRNFDDGSVRCFALWLWYAQHSCLDIHYLGMRALFEMFMHFLEFFLFWNYCLHLWIATCPPSRLTCCIRGAGKHRAVLFGGSVLFGQCADAKPRQ